VSLDGDKEIQHSCSQEPEVTTCSLSTASVQPHSSSSTCHPSEKKKKQDYEATQISVKISSECYTFMCLLEQIVVLMMMKDLMGFNVYSCSGS